MKKKYFVNLVLLIIALIACFAFLEIAFRLFGIGEYDKGDYIVIKHADYNPFLIFGPHINKSIPQQNGEIAYWNFQGFRMNETLQLAKKPNEYRIFALGGSTTEDLANRQNMHYSEEATKILEKYNPNGKKIIVVNSGRNGYSTAQILVRVQFDLLPFEPDMITVMENINDLSVNFFPSDERKNYANKYLDIGSFVQPYSIKDSFLSESRVIVFFYKSISAIKNKFTSKTIVTDSGKKVSSNIHYSETSIEPKFKQEFSNNLISIAALAKAHGIEVVFMSQPAAFSEDKYALMFGYQSYNDRILYPKLDDFKKMFLEYNNVIKEVAEQEDVNFIDMYNLMGHDEKYFVDMVHYSPDGVTRFAKIYSDNLKKIIDSKTNS